MIAALVVLLLIAAAAGAWFVSVYNQLVRKRAMKEEGWSGVDVQLQKRSDLIGLMIETVKKYLTHEKDVLENIARLRSTGRDASDMAAVSANESELTRQFGRLMIAIENYPELRSNQNITKLQEEMAGAENDLQMARRYYNATVRDYNILIDSFPSNLVANAFHHVKGAFFEMPDRDAAKRPSFE